MKELKAKMLEALVSALPVTAIAYILALTPLFSLSAAELVTFTVGAVMLVVGIGLFSMGADLAMTPMGSHVGSGLSRQKKLGLLLGVCFVLGTLITIAEPDLQVLANQVSAVLNGTLLIYTVGLGEGAFLVIAIMKIVFQKSLAHILMLFYMLLFALALLLVVNGNETLLPMAFDSGGVATGPITVPFIMALGVVFTYAGLVIFLTDVNLEFTPIGYKLGHELSQLNDTFLILFGLATDVLVVLAEHAIHVLNSQVEDVTGGLGTATSDLVELLGLESHKAVILSVAREDMFDAGI